MENKQLELQIADSIRGDIGTGIINTSKSLSFLTLEHMKEFSEWLRKEDWFYDKLDSCWRKWHGKIALPKTAEQLIKLYFTSKEKS